MNLMKNVLFIFSVSTVLLLSGCNLSATEEREDQVAIQPVVQPVVQPTPTDETENWQTYQSQGTFNFKYPKQDCDFNGKCYDIKLNATGNKIAFMVEDREHFLIYYGRNISDKNAANKFIQTALSNPFCEISSTEDRIGGSIKTVFLGGDGCIYYDSVYQEYRVEHPDAVGLTGKTRTYWNTDSKEFIHYTLGSGGGCAFFDCSIESKISASMSFGENDIQEKMNKKK